MKLPEKKRIIQIGVIFGLLLLIGGVRFFSGNEDAWLCENGVWIRHGNPSLPFPTELCEENENIVDAIENSFLKNASSSQSEDAIYCLERKGKIEYRVRGDGQGFDVCVFPRGRECEVSSYVEEQCPQNGASILGLKTSAAYYCVTMGGEYRPTRDSFYRTAKERGNCVFLNGRICPVLDFWNGICERSLPTTKELQTGASTSISDAIIMTDFPGEFLTEDPMLKIYGTSVDLIFKKIPSVLTLLRRFVPTFEQIEMKNSFPVFVAHFSDTRKLIFFGGCSNDGCAGTKRIAAYDPKKKKIYFLREREDRSILDVYGSPDIAIQNALFAFYFSLE